MFKSTVRVDIFGSRSTGQSSQCPTNTDSLNHPESAFPLPVNDRRMEDRPTVGGGEVNSTVMNEPVSEVSGEAVDSNVSLVVGRLRMAAQASAKSRWQLRPGCWDVARGRESCRDRNQSTDEDHCLYRKHELGDLADAVVVVPAQQETDHGSGAGSQGSPACVKQIRPLLERQPDATKLRI